ncbi:MAG: ATP-binding protein, partial [Usitatibacteraceae bacterium]
MTRLSGRNALEKRANAGVSLSERVIPTLTNTVEIVLRRHALEGKCVCVALSGGVDSVVLLDAVDELKTALRLDVRAIHVHHGLSPNAAAWAAFCTAL